MITLFGKYELNWYYFHTKYVSQMTFFILRVK